MAMKLLWIATKPPWPPRDGGRLVVLETLRALAAQGVRITLVSPVDPELPASEVREIEEALAPVCTPRLVPARPGSAALAALGSLLGGPPVSLGRHRLPAVAAEAARCLEEEEFDRIHVEQLQALAQAERALETSGERAPAAGGDKHPPVLLRAQNVESDLWRATAGLSGGLRGWFLEREARRLAEAEGRAVARIEARGGATVALTERDARRLEELAASAMPEAAEVKVRELPAPFPERLPPGEVALTGEPPLMILGTAGWLPNQEGARWFLAEAWPRVREAVPGAGLHLFGGLPRGAGQPSQLAAITVHPPPEDSRQAFWPGAILLVPLRIASGVRMKILEAWARGTPVVATPEAAAGLGLGARPEELLLAEDGPGFARAVGRVMGEEGLRDRLVEAGRRRLAEHHDPARVAVGLLGVEV